MFRKISILMIAFASLSTAAFADTNPGYVAQLMYTGGFVAPGRFNSGVRILENGDVVAIRNNQVTDVVGQLSTNVLASLRKEFTDAAAGKLTDLDSGKPICMDTPRGSYTVVNKNGEAVELAATMNCHKYVLQGSVDSELAKTVLDAFQRLSVLP